MGVGEWRDGGGWVPEENGKEPGNWDREVGVGEGRCKAPSRAYLALEISQQLELCLLNNFHTEKLQE